MSNFIIANFVTIKAVVGGICLFFAGAGFFIFDLTSKLGEDNDNPLNHVRGLIVSAIVFIGIGMKILFLDENFFYGVAHAAAGIALIMLVIGWRDDNPIVTGIATVLSLSSFIALGILPTTNPYIIPIRIGFILFGIGIAIFEISDRLQKNLFFLIGGMFCFVGTILLSGGLIIEGLERITKAFINTIPLNQDTIKSISFIVFGIGIIGVMLGLLFAGPKVTGMGFLIVGFGYLGLTLAYTILSVGSYLGGIAVMGVSMIPLIWGAVSGINLLFLGKGTIFNDEKTSKNNMIGAFVGFISFSIYWFINREILLGIASIGFTFGLIFTLIYTIPMMSSSKMEEKKQKITSIRQAIYYDIYYSLVPIICSLFFAAILIYSGIA